MLHFQSLDNLLLMKQVDFREIAMSFASWMKKCKKIRKYNKALYILFFGGLHNKSAPHCNGFRLAEQQRLSPPRLISIQSNFSRGLEIFCLGDKMSLWIWIKFYVPQTLVIV